MLYARVDGSVVATTAHPSMRGRRTVICQPLDADGNDDGTPVLAVDPFGAGLHQRVIVSSDGSTTRERVGDERSPLRNLILGLVDN